MRALCPLLPTVNKIARIRLIDESKTNKEGATLYAGWHQVDASLKQFTALFVSIHILPGKPAQHSQKHNLQIKP